MKVRRTGPRFSAAARVLAILLAVGVPLGAFLLQKPATEGESGGLALRGTGGVWFCSQGSTDPGISEIIDIANASSRIARGRYTVFAGDSPSESEQIAVVAGGRASIELDRETLGEPAGRQVGTVVEMDITTVAVAETVAVSGAEATGTMSAPCTTGTSGARYYAGGTSVRGANTYLLLFNPFPQDAVVNVDVFTDDGIERPKNLQQFPLFAGRGAVVSLSEEVRRESGLGAYVRTESGQVVSAITVHSTGERIPAGVALSGGSARPASEWYFADGSSDLAEMVWVMNTDDTDAKVEIEYYPEGSVTNTPSAQSLAVPALSEATMVISPGFGPGVNYGFAVKSIGDRQVVVDRLAGVPAPPLHGLTVGPGAPSGVTKWVIPNAWGGASAQPYASTLAVVNPSSAPARLTAGRLDDGAVSVPAGMNDVVVPARSRVTFDMSVQFPGIRSMSLAGWSDRPLVAETRVTATSPRVGFESLHAFALRDDFPMPPARPFVPTVVAEPSETSPTIAPPPAVTGEAEPRG